MTGSDAALLALLVASALHLGFQLTVTMVVYPALARVDDAGWKLAHTRHSRGITPLVVLTYGALMLSGAWALFTLFTVPTGRSGAWVLVSVTGALIAGLTTASAAAPLHRRLAHGRDEALVDRLVRADRLRALGAVVSLVGAALAVVTAHG
jgi:hypothetical protein